MTTCLGKNCSFDLPRVPFVNCCHVFSYFEGRMWDLIVSVPNHCLSFYFIELLPTDPNVFVNILSCKPMLNKMCFG